MFGLAECQPEQLMFVSPLKRGCLYFPRVWGLTLASGLSRNFRGLQQGDCSTSHANSSILAYPLKERLPSYGVYNSCRFSLGTTCQYMPFTPLIGAASSQRL